MWSTGVLLTLAGCATAELARPYWRPLGLDRRNATAPPPSGYFTPSTTTIPTTSSSFPPGSITSSSAIATSVSTSSYRFTYSPDTSSRTSSPGSTTVVSPISYVTASTGGLTSGTRPPPYIKSPSNSGSLPATGTAPIAAVCSGATLNVLGASLDWWYYETYTYIATTLVVQFDTDDVQTGWTAIPATTTFDIASALANPTCTVTTTYDSINSQSVVDEVCLSTPAPVAAATTIVDQVAYRTLNDTTGTSTSLPNVAITPAPAAITIPSSGGNFSAGTPFVFFSKYEIMSKRPTTYGNGSVGCAETTSVYNMSSPFSFEFTGGDVNGSLEVNAGVTGDVAPAFLGVVNITNAVAGSWVAEPTVAVVVVQTVAAQAVLAAHTEISASNLATPTPTLPSGVSLISTQPTQPGTYTYASARIESSETALDVPTKASPVSPINTAGSETTANVSPDASYTDQRTYVGHIESQETTLVLPTPTNGEYIVTSVGGEKITATAIGAITTGGGQGGSGGGLGVLVSAIISAAAPTTPTNALQVLTQALGTAYNPTASAIVAGLGGGMSQILPSSGSSQQGGPGSSGQNSGVGSGNVGGAANERVMTVGSQIYTASAGSTYNIGGQSLTPGGVVTVSGTTISLASGGSVAVVNGHTQTIGATGNNPATITAPAVLTVNGQVIAPNSGATYVISGQTLTPGGAITITAAASGLETVSLNSAANQLVTIQNGHTGTSFIGGLAGAAPTGAPILTIDGKTYSAASGSSGSGATYIINGQTLTPGGQITISGPNGPETISLQPGGAAIVQVAAGKTTTSSISGAYAGNLAPPVLTIGGQTFTAINNGATYLIGGSTLTRGEVETVTISGQVYIISLSPSASVLEIEAVGPNGKVTATSYETLFPATAIGSTVTNTVFTGGATQRSSVTAGASATSTGKTGAPGYANDAPRFGGSSLFALAFAVLVLAVWL